MTESPSGPCFGHTPGTSEFWLEEEILDQQLISMISLSSGRPQKLLIFDAAGTMWRMNIPDASRYQTIFWRVASQFYNPSRALHVSFECLRTYELSELLAVFKTQVERDDDCLTQFYEHEEIYPMLNDCRSFDDAVNVWRRITNNPQGEGI